MVIFHSYVSLPEGMSIQSFTNRKNRPPIFRSSGCPRKAAGHLGMFFRKSDHHSTSRPQGAIYKSSTLIWLSKEWGIKSKSIFTGENDDQPSDLGGFPQHFPTNPTQKTSTGCIEFNTYSIYQYISSSEFVLILSHLSYICHMIFIYVISYVSWSHIYMYIFSIYYVTCI